MQGKGLKSLVLKGHLSGLIRSMNKANESESRVPQRPQHTLGSHCTIPYPPRLQRNKTGDVLPTEHPPNSEPTSKRMRRPDEARQPSRGCGHLHSGHSLRKAWLPRHRKTPWQRLSRITAPKRNKGKNCLACNAFPFQSLTSGSSAGSGPCLSLPVAFRSAAVGSCVRCCRFRHAAGIFS